MTNGILSLNSCLDSSVVECPSWALTPWLGHCTVATCLECLGSIFSYIVIRNTFINTFIFKIRFFRNTNTAIFRSMLTVNI